jgi:acetyl esterase
LITAGFDPLCDEGKDYANFLKSNGNNVSKLHFPDLFHGFVNLTNIRKAEKSTIQIIESIRKYL